MDMDLQENDRRAYGVRLGFGRRPAFLLIDFLRGCFEPAYELFGEVDPNLAPAHRLRAAARAASAPVIFTRMEVHTSFGNSGWFHEKVLPLRHRDAGDPMRDLATPIEVEPGEIVVGKQDPSAFLGTSIASTLTDLGCDRVLLTGVATSGCVRASRVDAMSDGLRAIADACGDRHPDPHKANLFDMNAKDADVVSDTETLADLAGLQAAAANQGSKAP